MDSRKMPSSLRVDFFVIGAPKAATTWLAHCLADHPGICVSSPKEPHFFAQEVLTSPSSSDLGLGWYASCFRHCRETQVIGELSTSYLACQSSAGQIQAHFPDAKIIALLRNPIDALFSHYKYSTSIYKMNVSSFESFLAQHPNFIDTYRYFTNLTRYFKLFSKEQIMIVTHESIKQNPYDAIRAVYQFLGVRSDIVPASISHRVNESGQTKNPAVRDFLHFCKNCLDRTRVTRYLYRRLQLDQLGLRIQLWNSKPSQEQIQPATRKNLATLYAEENKKLMEQMGVDTTSWN